MVTLIDFNGTEVSPMIGLPSPSALLNDKGNGKGMFTPILIKL
jgi:hypothetical protein